MPSDGLTVAVTGPTGDLGIAIVEALERERRAKKVVGMARRPFDPAELGWKKTEYTQGDVTDAKSVKTLVKGADVVIHLAFAIFLTFTAYPALKSSPRERIPIQDWLYALLARSPPAICTCSTISSRAGRDGRPGTISRSRWSAWCCCSRRPAARSARR